MTDYVGKRECLNPLAEGTLPFGMISSHSSPASDDFSKKLLRFLPNLRTASVEAKSGYLWGKSVFNSHILKTLSPETYKQLQSTDIVAERWIVSDDSKFPSLVLHGGDVISFPKLLAENGSSLLGSEHLKKFGPCLKVMMKLLDTHDTSTLGSLSVQVHPKVGHVKRPAKLEMWKGHGNLYLGWNQNMNPSLIAESSSSGTLENYLNKISLNGECVVVPGGIVHAIRYASFLSEWSEAPGIEDTRSIQDSTISLYDRTDGKPARPGKEDLQGALDLLSDTNTFEAFRVSLQLPESIEKKPSFERWKLFNTPQVHVEEWRIFKEFSLNLEKRGFPAYVENGSGEVWRDEHKLACIKSGEELFFPAALERVTFKALTTPLVIQVWQAPLEGKGLGKLL